MRNPIVIAAIAFSLILSFQMAGSVFFMTIMILLMKVFNQAKTKMTMFQKMPLMQA